MSAVGGGAKVEVSPLNTQVFVEEEWSVSVKTPLITNSFVGIDPVDALAKKEEDEVETVPNGSKRSVETAVYPVVSDPPASPSVIASEVFVVPPNSTLSSTMVTFFAHDGTEEKVKLVPLVVETGV